MPLQHQVHTSLAGQRSKHRKGPENRLLSRLPGRRMTSEQAEHLESTFEKLRSVLPPEMAAQLPPLDLPKSSPRSLGGSSGGTTIPGEAVQVLAAAKAVSAIQARCSLSESGAWGVGKGTELMCHCGALGHCCPTSALHGQYDIAASMSAKALLAMQAEDLIIRMGLGLTLRSGAHGCSAEAGSVEGCCVEQTRTMPAALLIW